MADFQTSLFPPPSFVPESLSPASSRSPATRLSRRAPAWCPPATASASCSDKTRERPAAPFHLRAPAAPPASRQPERDRQPAIPPPRSDPASAKEWPARLGCVLARPRARRAQVCDFDFQPALPKLPFHHLGPRVFRVHSPAIRERIANRQHALRARSPHREITVPKAQVVDPRLVGELFGCMLHHRIRTPDQPGVAMGGVQAPTRTPFHHPRNPQSNAQ